METDLEKRCPTGISGLDKLIEGGFPRGRTILITGSCGTGKTIFGTQFIYKGVTQYNEAGIFVLLEQDPDEFKDDMLEFNFDLEQAEKDGKLVIINASLSKLGIEEFIKDIPVSSKSFSLTPGETVLEKLVDVIIRVAKKTNTRRVVIDSIPALDLMVADKEKVRRMILLMNYKLKKAGLTTILISETSDDDEMATHGVEKYVVDGVILLKYTTIGPDAGRSLTISKMRKTSHSEDIHTLKFVKGKGIQLLKD